MKIIADDNIPFLRGRLEEVAEVVYVDQFGFTPEVVRDADAVVIRTRTRCDEALLGGSKVRLVATATIGMDQIDLPWCAAAGIKVSNAPGCNAPGVAQYVWSALLRMGFDPKRDTLGIVGCGNVGSVVFDWGRQLGVKMLVSDPPKEEAMTAKETGTTQKGGDISNSNHGEVNSKGGNIDSWQGVVEYVPLDELLRRSDAVTLHTPLTRDGKYPSYHLIGEKELELIGDGKILVNAARGPVVDFAALRPHVLSGRIRTVIDTWEGEPKVDEEILAAVDFGTFHIAGYSRQGKERATRMAIEAVEREFGVTVDKNGLEPVYTGTPGITDEMIIGSYDPTVDSEALKKAPAEFDRLRRDYCYRDEPR